VQYCQSCHGANKTGALGPSLVNINDRVNFENFQTVVTTGRAQMPGFLHIGEQNVIDLYKFLSNIQSRQARFGAASPTTKLPDGPVVASGGAPLPAASATAGAGRNAVRGYPEGVTAPKVRYVDGSTSAYGLGHPDLVSPPWSSISAYDLNTGTVKWKRALGNDDKTGAKDTGIPSGPQGKGMVVTATGIIFATCLDGRIYAYDEDNGNILWSVKLPRVPEGIPAMYEAGGRQYLVVGATGDVLDKSKPEAEVPRGYITYSLPQKMYAQSK
jgi:quinoprotein glucose dehydrogenase